ncbi:MAG TPA: hydroxypyruvate isomerase [Macromonas sp.]|nr:hydroxypyruvate isomerase [Macromonas sp.]
MPSLAANLSLLYPELPFLDRFAAAARSGFRAVEFQFPYAFDVADIAQRLKEHRLQLVLHNLPAGDWAAGERGIACHPERVDEFRAGVQQALAYARVLGTPRLNCLAGVLPSGVSQEAAQATLVANLRHAATALQAAGIELLVEFINTFDIPGFFVHRTDQALALLDEVAHPNLKLQYDLYHAQRMEGNLVHTLRQHLPRIGHIQLADSPDRHEPGTGEINFHFVLQELDRLGYAGHVGCEYFPADAGLGGTDAGLAWVPAHGLGF